MAASRHAPPLPPPGKRRVGHCDVSHMTALRTPRGCRWPEPHRYAVRAHPRAGNLHEPAAAAEDARDHRPVVSQPTSPGAFPLAVPTPGCTRRARLTAHGLRTGCSVVQTQHRVSVVSNADSSFAACVASLLLQSSGDPVGALGAEPLVWQVPGDGRRVRDGAGGPSSPKPASRSYRRALKCHRSIPGHSIAAVGAVKSSLWATAGGKGA